MSRKFLHVEIPYEHKNAKKVVSLVEAFRKAGKLHAGGQAKSALTFDDCGVVNERRPTISFLDVWRLKRRGAKRARNSTRSRRRKTTPLRKRKRRKKTMTRP